MIVVAVAVIVIAKLRMRNYTKSSQPVHSARKSDSDSDFMPFSGKILPEMRAKDSPLALAATITLLNGEFGSKTFIKIEETLYRNRDSSVVVFKGCHKMHGVVAVKMVSIGHADTKRRCKREDYLLETFSVKRLICRRFDSKVIERAGFNPVQVLVLEYMEKGTVASMLERAPAGRLDQSTAARIGIDVLSGLQSLHEHGIVHRDVKDSNIGVTSKDGAMAFKILDLGISVAEDPGGAGLRRVHAYV